MKKNVFLTGVTGNVGCYLLKFLLTDNTINKIYVLIRGEDYQSVSNRFRNIMKFVYNDAFNKVNLTQVIILNGDVSIENFGLSNENYRRIISDIDIIYHSAALTKFQDPITNLRKVNVGGTARIIKLIKESKKKIALNYISTAFISGDHDGKFYENDFNLGQDFNNPYEKSKFEAEELVRKFLILGNNVKIYRPSIVVGSYESGAISDFQMFYKPLYLLTKNIFQKIPVWEKCEINLIPVDLAAKMIYLCSSLPFNKERTIYHIVSPEPFNIVQIISTAEQYFNFKQPVLGNELVFGNNLLSKLYKKPIKPFLKYFTFRARFQSQKTFQELRKINFSFPKLENRFLIKIFDFAVKMKYLEKNIL